MKLTKSFYETLDAYVDLSGNDFYGCAEQGENYCGEVCHAPCYLGAEDCVRDAEPTPCSPFPQPLTGEL